MTFAPERILLSALDRGDALSLVRLRSLRGEMADGVRVPLGADTVTMWFDRHTGLPVATETLTNDDVLGDRRTINWYTRWQDAGGVLLPRQADTEGTRPSIPPSSSSPTRWRAEGGEPSLAGGRTRARPAGGRGAAERGPIRRGTRYPEAPVSEPAGDGGGAHSPPPRSQRRTPGLSSARDSGRGALPERRVRAGRGGGPEDGGAGPALAGKSGAGGNGRSRLVRPWHRTGPGGTLPAPLDPCRGDPGRLGTERRDRLYERCPHPGPQPTAGPSGQSGAGRVRSRGWDRATAVFGGPRRNDRVVGDRGSGSTVAATRVNLLRKRIS